MHHNAKFYQNQSHDCWDIAFNNILNDSRHPPSWIFLTLNFLTTVKLWLTNMCDHAKFHQNHRNCYADIVIFLIFEMAGVCNLGFWKFWNFWSLISLGRRICIALTNYIEISQTSAKISHLTLIHIAAVCRNRFVKIWYLNSVLVVLILQKFEYITRLTWKHLFTLSCSFGIKNRGKWKLPTFLPLYECNNLELTLGWLICNVVRNFIKISQTIVEISHLTPF